MTEYEKMLNGELYNSADPELARMRLEARLLFKKYNEVSPIEQKERDIIIKKLFGTTGENIFVEPNFMCDYGKNIHVGENFYSNFNLTILDCAEVIIGKNCMIAPNVSIYTATHPISPHERNSGKEYAKKVVIGDNCWICGNVTICPGVTIGNDVVIGAGSVVKKSVGNGVILEGNPAVITKYVKY